MYLLLMASPWSCVCRGMEQEKTRSSAVLWRKSRRPSWLTQAALLHYYCISFITAITCLFNTSGMESQFPYCLPCDLMESLSSLLHIYPTYMQRVTGFVFHCFCLLNPDNLTFLPFFPSFISRVIFLMFEEK